MITDEIYEHLTYDGALFSSMPVQVPELADTCIVLNGVAKTYAMTGWRVGWLIGPRDVVKAATNLQSHLTSNVANVSQQAAIAALTGDLSAVATMREAFDRRRRTMVAMLNEIDGVECPTPQGAFYAYPSVKGVLGREIAGRTPRTSAELAELILEEAEVAVVPGEAFGPSGYLRLSYALGDDDLVEGVAPDPEAARLATAISRWPGRLALTANACSTMACSAAADRRSTGAASSSGRSVVWLSASSQPGGVREGEVGARAPVRRHHVGGVTQHRHPRRRQGAGRSACRLAARNVRPPSPDRTRARTSGCQLLRRWNALCCNRSRTVALEPSRGRRPTFHIT